MQTHDKYADHIFWCQATSWQAAVSRQPQATVNLKLRMAPACVMLTARSTVLRKRAAFPPRGLMCIKVSMKSACCAIRLHAVAWPCLISVSFLSCSAFSSYRSPTFAMASFSFRNCSRGPETPPRQPQPFPNGIARVTFNPPPTLFLRWRLLQKLPAVTTPFRGYVSFGFGEGISEWSITWDEIITQWSNSYTNTSNQRNIQVKSTQPKSPIQMGS